MQLQTLCWIDVGGERHQIQQYAHIRHSYPLPDAVLSDSELRRAEAESVSAHSKRGASRETVEYALLSLHSRAQHAET